MQKIQEYSLWIIDRAFRFFGKSANEYESRSIHRLEKKIEFTKGVNGVEQQHYDHIMGKLNNNAVSTAFHLAVAQYLYPEFYHMLKELTGQGATLSLALKLTGEEGAYTHIQQKSFYNNLRNYLSIDKKSWNFLYTELFADERLVLYLSGENKIAGDLEKFSQIYIPGHSEKIYGMDKHIEEVKIALSNTAGQDSAYILQLCGEQGRGKKTILKAIAESTNTGWIFTDYKSLKRAAGKDADYYVWLVKREAYMYGYGICYDYDSPEKIEDIEKFIEECLLCSGDLPAGICICTDEQTEIIPYTGIQVRKVSVPKCSRHERIEVWKGLSIEKNINLNYEKYGTKFILNPGDIKKIFDSLVTVYRKGIIEQEMDRLIADFCVDVKAAPKKGSIKRVSSLYTMEDLKIKPKQKDTLKNICSYIKYSHEVYDIWNMERKYAYGKNVTALFYGPPGTGKTMAANVLSNELKMPLYRIDLSQVVDKYIGETEKRLEEIFTYARSSNVILFFDEADALFSKRTEVKESKDKYANTEVSYILQRIEQFDGIILLATNFRNNIDDAFMRRMKYVVEFEMPDKETRKEIWESGFSREVPLEDIDFEYLAENVELSGGYIKNIILNSVFLGAGECGKVTMKHILLSVTNEYMKLGKVLKPQDFGKYAYYFI